MDKEIFVRKRGDRGLKNFLLRCGMEDDGGGIGPRKEIRLGGNCGRMGYAKGNMGYLVCGGGRL